jgi:hypothetical protein
MGSAGRVIQSQVLLAAVLVGRAAADPVVVAPDVPPRSAPATAGGPSHLPPSWNLDGTYLWLAPTLTASYFESKWDSSVGGSAGVVRIREHEPLGLIGGTFGGSLWSANNGGRVWLDALAGTEIFGHMAGVSAGPILDLSEEAHPRAGGSVGVWAFAGVTVFARAGTFQGLGNFAEIGVHIALPVLRTHAD